MPGFDFQSLFNEDPERQLVSGPGATSEWRIKPRSLMDDDSDPRFPAFQQAWQQGADLGDLFGPEPFKLQGTVAPSGGDNTRADVAKVQTLLGKTGHLDLGSDGPSGYANPNTDKAIRDFQKDNGLQVDGVLKPNGPTISKLGGLLGGQAAVASPNNIQARSGNTVRNRAGDLLSMLAGETPEPTRWLKPGIIGMPRATLAQATPQLPRTETETSYPLFATAEAGSTPTPQSDKAPHLTSSTPQPTQATPASSPIAQVAQSMAARERAAPEIRARNRLGKLGFEVVDDTHQGPLSGSQVTQAEYDRMLNEAKDERTWDIVDAGMYAAQKAANISPRETNLAAHKDDWVRNHSTLINVTARRHGIPPEILAGIAHTETGGMPDSIDNLANIGRGISEQLHNSVRSYLPGSFQVSPMDTSAGDVSIQLRNVAKQEGMPVASLDGAARSELIGRLQHDKAYALDKAARYVKDTLNKAYPDYQGGALSEKQVMTLGYGYNMGYPHAKIDPANPSTNGIEIGRGRSNYGPDLAMKLGRMRELLGGGK